MCSQIGMSAPSNTVWTGRARVRVSSMLYESMPTSTAPDAARWRAAASVRNGCSEKYRSVRQCVAHPVWTSTALPATSQALYLVQRIRDEAHRFAITYHRQLRAKAQTKSVLDDLPGVGPARKRALLKVFGSTKQMRSATLDEIAAVPGISRKLAEKIRAGLDA